MEGSEMNKKPYKTVDFEVIEIWYNDIYAPYTRFQLQETLQDCRF